VASYEEETDLSPDGQAMAICPPTPLQRLPPEDRFRHPLLLVPQTPHFLIGKKAFA